MTKPKPKGKAKNHKRRARRAQHPRPGARPLPHARGPVAVKAPPLGKVQQIIVQRGGQTFLHTFTTPPELHAAELAGVLVIRGRFKVDPKGFIEG